MECDMLILQLSQAIQAYPTLLPQAGRLNVTRETSVLLSESKAPGLSSVSHCVT